MNALIGADECTVDSAMRMKSRIMFMIMMAMLMLVMMVVLMRALSRNHHA